MSTEDLMIKGEPDWHIKHNNLVAKQEQDALKIGDLSGNGLSEIDLASAIKNDRISLFQKSQQLFDYTFNKNKGGVIYGEEYLSAFHKKIMNFDYTLTTQLKIRTSGDSTMAGDSTTSTAFHIDQLIQNMAYQNGLPQIKGENGGHSGKDTEHWNQTYVTDDINSNSDLLILRWGINDPYYKHIDNSMLADQSTVNPSIDEQRRTASDFEASLRSGLTKIRASKNSSQLSIVLMTPNSVSDTPNGRDQRWVESLVPIIQKASRDFQCCFINTYQYLQDSINASDFMDNPYGDGRHIHPNDVMNLWISTLMFETIFPKGLIEKCGNAKFINDYYANIIKNSTELPSDYPNGISIYRSQGTFPYDGHIITIKGIDGTLTQINNSYKTDQDGIAFRKGATSSNIWGAWFYLGKSENSIRPTLQNSWVDYLPSSNSYAIYYKDNSGIIHLEGLIKNGTISNGTVLFTLPIGYRPIIDRFFNCANDVGSSTQISISPNGNVTIQKNGSNGYLSLDGISFRAI